MDPLTFLKTPLLLGEKVLVITAYGVPSRGCHPCHWFNVSGFPLTQVQIPLDVIRKPMYQLLLNLFVLFSIWSFRTCNSCSVSMDTRSPPWYWQDFLASGHVTPFSWMEKHEQVLGVTEKKKSYICANVNDNKNGNGAMKITIIRIKGFAIQHCNSLVSCKAFQLW